MILQIHWYFLDWHFQLEAFATQMWSVDQQRWYPLVACKKKSAECGPPTLDPLNHHQVTLMDIKV